MRSSNEYMRKYMRERYHRRRSQWIEKLGGKCARCSSRDNLNFDHKDRDSKEFDISKALAGWSDLRITAEMSKCQILCHSCHVKKTNEHGDHGKNVVTHGTYWMYRKYKCRCSACVTANTAKLREWTQKRKGQVVERSNTTPF